MYIVWFCLIYLSVFGAETIKADESQIDILDTFKLLYFVTIASEHRSEYLKFVLIQIHKWSKDRTQTNFLCFPTKEIYAWKLTVYVFNMYSGRESAKLNMV